MTYFQSRSQPMVVELPTSSSISFAREIATQMRLLSFTKPMRPSRAALFGPLGGLGPRGI